MRSGQGAVAPVRTLLPWMRWEPSDCFELRDGKVLFWLHRLPLSTGGEADGREGGAGGARSCCWGGPGKAGSVDAGESGGGAGGRRGSKSGRVLEMFWRRSRGFAAWRAPCGSCADGQGGVLSTAPTPVRAP